MNDIEKLHDGSPIVRDRSVSLVVMDELVHSPGAEGCTDAVSDGGAGVDVADYLRFALRCVRPFLQQYDLRLHHRRHCGGRYLPLGFCEGES